MRQKAIEFVRKAVTNQRIALEKYHRISELSDHTNTMLAHQHAVAVETLEVWEIILRAIDRPECAPPEGSSER